MDVVPTSETTDHRSRNAGLPAEASAKAGARGETRTLKPLQAQASETCAYTIPPHVQNYSRCHPEAVRPKDPSSAAPPLVTNFLKLFIHAFRFQIPLSDARKAVGWSNKICDIRSFYVA